MRPGKLVDGTRMACQGGIGRVGVAIDIVHFNCAICQSSLYLSELGVRIERKRGVTQNFGAVIDTVHKMQHLL